MRDWDYSQSERRRGGSSSWSADTAAWASAKKWHKHQQDSAGSYWKQWKQQGDGVSRRRRPRGSPEHDSPDSSWDHAAASSPLPFGDGGGSGVAGRQFAKEAKGALAAMKKLKRATETAIKMGEFGSPMAGVVPPGDLGFPPVTDFVAALEAELQRKLLEVALSEQDKSEIRSAMEELQSTVSQLGQKWRSSLFGSVANGFGVRCSDLDVTCSEEGHVASQAADEGRAAKVLGERLGPLFKDHPNFEVISKVLHAKVPILRLRFQNLDIDLSCENLKAVTNTRLLKAYASIDRRVREVGIAVKLWAQANRVCGAATGNLSSYSFTIMTIYFMQNHPEVMLPKIETSHFEAGSRWKPEDLVKLARGQWKCTLKSVELLHRFFWFYSEWFVWGEEVVSIRLGARMAAYQDYFSNLRGRYATRLHIEDPYELERNLNCVLGEVQEGWLKEALSSAHQIMEAAHLPEGLRLLKGQGGSSSSKSSGAEKGPPASASSSADMSDEAVKKKLDEAVKKKFDEVLNSSTDSCGSTVDASGSELTGSGQSQHSDHEEASRTSPASLEAAVGEESITECVLPKEVRVGTHPYPLHLITKLSMTWRCTHQSVACTRPTDGLSRRWSCLITEYDLCRGCMDHWREAEPEPVQVSPYGDCCEELPASIVRKDLVSKTTTASARITARVAGLCNPPPCRSWATRSPLVSRSTSRILALVTKAYQEQDR
jgi:DNA polymerase sigma